jgi:hypothetical protein
MSKIRRSAKGESCTLRWPGCLHDTYGAIVLAHLPHPAKGMGNKGPDFHAIYACSRCHDILDRRDRCMEVDWRDVLRALAETQARLVEKGLMEVAA